MPSTSRLRPGAGDASGYATQLALILLAIALSIGMGWQTLGTDAVRPWLWGTFGAIGAHVVLWVAALTFLNRWDD
jgi:hypothetical protein